MIALFDATPTRQEEIQVIEHSDVADHSQETQMDPLLKASFLKKVFSHKYMALIACRRSNSRIRI